MQFRSTLIRLLQIPRQIKVLILGVFVNNLGTMIVPYLTLVLSKKLAFSVADTSFVVAAYGAGGFLAVFIGGRISDRLGRAHTLSFNMIAAGIIAMTVPHFATSVPLLSVATFLLALFNEAHRPIASAMVADWIDPKNRQFVFSAVRVATNLGVSVGLSIGGIFFDLGWGWIFRFDGLTSVFYGVIVVVLMKNTVATDHPSNTVNLSPAVDEKRRNVALFLALFANLLLALAYITHSTVLPLTISNIGGYRGTTIGLLLAINTIMVVLLELPLSHQISRFRRLKVAAVGFLLTGLGLGLSGVGHHWVWYSISIAIWTLGEMLAISQVMSFIMDCSPTSRRGETLGLYSMTWRIAYTFGPPLFLFVYQAVAPIEFWIIVPVFVLVGALILIFLDKTYAGAVQ